MITENQKQIEQAQETSDRPHPRCLATLPSDIEELLAEFRKQGQL